MKLEPLLREIPGAEIGALPEVEITALTADSREVVPGALFVAVQGGEADGHRFLGEAARRGAAAALGQQPAPGLGMPYVQVTDSRAALAALAAAWHGHPARALVMIGVTGTDGKTTTTTLIHRILQAAGAGAGMITSVSALVGDRALDTGLHVTTPGALELQGYLAEMVAAGLMYCVVEATSHGLAQRRVDACEFDLGVVTNITHEHLDFHGSLEAYRAAKARLFEGLSESAIKPQGPPKTAILNRDDSSYAYLRPRARVRQISYGLDPAAEVRADQVEGGADGLRFRVLGRGYDAAVSSPLVGAYNVSNVLAAFAACVEGLGFSPEQAAAGIAAMRGVPGRMEVIDVGQPFTAIVDFAHTPNALRRALQTARRLTSGRVIAVFGSAGLRDRAKRRLMAEVSADLADVTVLTAEDPRTESLEAILEEMANGARARGGLEGKSFHRVPDRGDALRLALRIAEPGDLVIACGKGHEQSMCFGEIEYTWDDRLAMRAALAELLGVEGPSMPPLPTSI